MAWGLNLQLTILLFKGSTAKEGTGLLTSMSKDMLSTEECRGL